MCWLVISERNDDMKREGDPDLAECFTKKCGQVMEGIAATCYISTWIAKDELERAGSADREKLHDALANKALIIENGEVVLSGGPELRDDPRVRTAYLGL